MLSLAEARARILGLAEPGEAIETSLTEALGLFLAEPALADVDSPPFDRAAIDGYALRAADGQEGARLRVVGLRRSRIEVKVGPGQAARVRAGDALPLGADAVARTEDSLPDAHVGPPREIELVRAVGPGQNVIARGFFLRAGAELAPAGSRVRLSMVGLLASQGCVHPVCHRRARVAVLAVGDHLVGPGEAPVMHRERNATGPAVVAPCLRGGATAHDLGAVSETDLASELDRALTAPVVVVLGPPEGSIPQALERAGVERVFEGVSLHPGKRLNYGVLRDGAGLARHHVFHLTANPNAALTVATLLLVPLISRLQGGPTAPPPFLRAVWTGPHRPTDDRLWAVPITLDHDPDGRLRAHQIDYRGKDDLLGYARADALALLPGRSGPWHGGEIVEVAPLGPWPIDS